MACLVTKWNMYLHIVVVPSRYQEYSIYTSFPFFSLFFFTLFFVHSAGKGVVASMCPVVSFNAASEPITPKPACDRHCGTLQFGYIDVAIGFAAPILGSVAA